MVVEIVVIPIKTIPTAVRFGLIARIGKGDYNTEKC
jgi:hypothetical protein